MSASRTEQCVSPARARRERASASIAFEASTPTPWLIRGASSSSTRPVPVPMSSSRPASASGTRASSAASTAAPGRSSARISSQSAPWRRKLSDATRARSASTRAAWRRSASRIGSSSGRRATRSRASAPGCAVRQGEPDVGALADPVQQAAVAQQLQVAGQARLRLAKDLGEFRHAEGAATGQRQQAQAGRFGGGTQAGQQALHGLANDINISLCPAYGAASR